MKKFMFMFAAVAALTLTAFNSCKTEGENTEEANVENVDSLAAPAFDDAAFAQTLATATNADSINAAIDNAKAAVEKLNADGKVEEANALMEKIEKVINDNAEAIKKVIPDFDAAKTLETVKGALGAATDAVKEAAGEAVDAAKDKAAEAVDAAKDKAAEAVDAAKDKAADAVDAAKDKAADAAQSAADALKK